ncbi:hypothetical protein AAOE16_07060 [Ekhidna sp. MALMAid0563]|uniref:hypothetical protein n=1 Tax=Ekhidna sp. MALMAid0563 TaxID=3143937 RepID=UPI0032DEB528
MCQGLPCVGHRVELTQNIERRGIQFVRGLRGVIRQENIARREVLVHFERHDVEIWLSENILRPTENLR